MQISNSVIALGLSALPCVCGCAALNVSQDAASGRLALQTQRPQDAVGYLRSATEVNPNYTIPNAVQVSALALLGRAYYEVGNFSEARTVLERALNRDKNDVTARLYRGLALIKSGEQERGRREVESALRGINEFLDDITAHTYSGAFWDPSREIRSDIQRALVPSLPVSDVGTLAEEIGRKFD
jgi:tetratricopeptide (TPR) repeat protein